MSVMAPPQGLMRTIELIFGPGFWNRWASGAWSRAGAGFVVTSWYRDPARNASVGGAAKSQHLIGLAIDLAGPSHGKAALAAELQAEGFTVIDEGDHLHVQTFPAGIFDR